MTSRAVVAALGEIVIVVEIWFGVSTETAPALIPVPENETVAPVTKPVPVIANASFVAPCPIEIGSTEMAVVPASMVRHAEQVPACESVFVTVTSRSVRAAPPDTERGTMRLVGELTVTVPAVTPVPETVTTAPFAKWVPVRVTSTAEAPRPRALGFALVTVGGEPPTEKQPEHVPLP
jgi:hypothetical protein